MAASSDWVEMEAGPDLRTAVRAHRATRCEPVLQLRPQRYGFEFDLERLPLLCDFDKVPRRVMLSGVEEMHLSEQRMDQRGGSRTLTLLYEVVRHEGRIGEPPPTVEAVREAVINRWRAASLAGSNWASFAALGLSNSGIVRETVALAVEENRRAAEDRAGLGGIPSYSRFDDQEVGFAGGSWAHDRTFSYVGRGPEVDTAAEARAKALLLRLLAPDQRETFERDGSFEVLGRSTGARYRIRSARQINIDDLTNGRKLCYVTPEVPLCDQLVAQKLLIEGDEKEFLRVAKAWPGLSSARASLSEVDERRVRALEYANHPALARAAIFSTIDRST